MNLIVIILLILLMQDKEGEENVIIKIKGLNLN